MRAWDLTLQLENRAGAFAELGEYLGSAGVNVESVTACSNDLSGQVHVVVRNRDAARTALKESGLTILSEVEVVMTEVPNRPGTLGEYARRAASQGINLDCLYVGAGTYLVGGSAGKLDRLEQAWGTPVTTGTRN